MSVYAHIEATFVYESREAYEKAVDVLRKGGWIDSRGFIVDEAGVTSDDKALNEKDLTISIPDGYYRNLLHYLDNLGKGARSRSGSWASTDGMFSGGDIAGEEYDLEDWAKKEGLEPRPQEEDFYSEDDYWENLSIWQEEVINSFMGRC